MLNLKLQYLGNLMWWTDSLEKTLMLGKIEGRRRGWQRIWWLNGITASMDMSLSSVRESWGAAAHGVAKNQTLWSEWTELNNHHHHHPSSEHFHLAKCTHRSLTPFSPSQSLNHQSTFKKYLFTHISRSDLNCSVRASLIEARRLSSCGKQAKFLQGMWDLSSLTWSNSHFLHRKADSSPLDHHASPSAFYLWGR